MSNAQQRLISQESGKLQIPYADYLALMEKVKDGQRMHQAKEVALTDLKHFLGGGHKVAESVGKVAAAVEISVKPQPETQTKPKKVAVEFVAEEPMVKAAEPVRNPSKAPAVRAEAGGIDIPPIKKQISVHFNNQDKSGRLFSVFKQYYTCLNDTCGGTVRVTMKDGFCSLWNYDEWEEFAFVDIFEGYLRVALDPRYTDELKSLKFCEVPRLLSSRRSLVCVQVDDLSNTMLDVLVKAFKEVGLAAS